MENLYLFIEMQEGEIKSIIAYDNRADANRKFRRRKKELTPEPNAYFMNATPSAIAFYRISPQLKIHRIDYFDEGME